MAVIHRVREHMPLPRCLYAERSRDTGVRKGAGIPCLLRWAGQMSADSGLERL